MPTKEIEHEARAPPPHDHAPLARSKPARHRLDQPRPAGGLPETVERSKQRESHQRAGKTHRYIGSGRHHHANPDDEPGAESIGQECADELSARVEEAEDEDDKKVCQATPPLELSL